MKSTKYRLKLQDGEVIEGYELDINASEAEAMFGVPFTMFNLSEGIWFLWQKGKDSKFSFIAHETIMSKEPIR